MIRAAASLFDVYIFVDWSAASRPKTGRDSIWIGVQQGSRTGAPSYSSFNPPTRFAAGELLESLLDSYHRADQRVLVGFDFALGYPAGTARALGLPLQEISPWQAMYQHLAVNCGEGEGNANTRFALAADMNKRISGDAHPFWGTPPRHAGPTLSKRKGDFTTPNSLPEHRRVEAWLKQNLQAHPKSVWQLLGVGAVGSQTLLGIPYVHRLRQRFPDSRIWPFETGWQSFTPAHLKHVPIVFAEVYPSLHTITEEPGEVRDAAQMRALCSYYSALDHADQLGPLFGPPERHAPLFISQIESEEGWILTKKR